MEFLSRALDDPAAARCGRCMNCTARTRREPLPKTLVQQAVDFLCGDSLTLEPRNRWPRPVLDDLHRVLPAATSCNAQGRPTAVIPEPLRAQPGRVLCIYGDAGWGAAVAQGKYETGRFGDDLVNAAAALVASGWQPEPPPAWVTFVPSLHRPGLVRDFAHRLAVRLDLPFHQPLAKVRENRPQKEMQNSVQQIRNVLGSFAVKGPVPAGPALLVDDVTDSGWTLTMLAVLLRQHGCGPVYPLALAKASPRGS